jgi:hypothetical protein
MVRRWICAHELRTRSASMPTADAILLHRIARGRRGPARRAAAFTAGLVLCAAVVAGAAVAVALVLALAVVAAPLAAGMALWLVWRSGDVAAREARRLRARVRRRARALGLTVVTSG